MRRGDQQEGKEVELREQERPVTPIEEESIQEEGKEVEPREQERPVTPIEEESIQEEGKEVEPREQEGPVESIQEEEQRHITPMEEEVPTSETPPPQKNQETKEKDIGISETATRAPGRRNRSPYRGMFTKSPVIGLAAEMRSSQLIKGEAQFLKAVKRAEELSRLEAEKSASLLEKRQRHTSDKTLDYDPEKRTPTNKSSNKQKNTPSTTSSIKKLLREMEGVTLAEDNTGEVGGGEGGGGDTQNALTTTDLDTYMKNNFLRKFADDGFNFYPIDDNVFRQNVLFKDYMLRHTNLQNILSFHDYQMQRDFDSLPSLSTKFDEIFGDYFHTLSNKTYDQDFQQKFIQGEQGEAINRRYRMEKNLETTHVFTSQENEELLQVARVEYFKSDQYKKLSTTLQNQYDTVKQYFVKQELLIADNNYIQLFNVDYRQIYQPEKALFRSPDQQAILKEKISKKDRTFFNNRASIILSSVEDFIATEEARNLEKLFWDTATESYNSYKYSNVPEERNDKLRAIIQHAYLHKINNQFEVIFQEKLHKHIEAEMKNYYKEPRALDDGDPTHKDRKLIVSETKDDKGGEEIEEEEEEEEINLEDEDTNKERYFSHQPPPPRTNTLSLQEGKKSRQNLASLKELRLSSTKANTRELSKGGGEQSQQNPHPPPKYQQDMSSLTIEDIKHNMNDPQQSLFHYNSKSTEWVDKDKLQDKILEGTKLEVDTSQYWKPCRQLDVESLVNFFEEVLDIQDNFSQQLNNIGSMSLKFLRIFILYDKEMIGEEDVTPPMIPTDDNMKYLLKYLLLQSGKYKDLEDSEDPNPDIFDYMKLLINRTSKSLSLHRPHPALQDIESNKTRYFNLLRYCVSRYIALSTMHDCISKVCDKVDYNVLMKIWAKNEKIKSTESTTKYPAFINQSPFREDAYLQNISNHMTTMRELCLLHDYKIDGRDPTVLNKNSCRNINRLKPPIGDHQSEREFGQLLLRKIPAGISLDTPVFQVNVLSELILPTRRSHYKLTEAEELAAKGALYIGGGSMRDITEENINIEEFRKENIANRTMGENAGQTVDERNDLLQENLKDQDKNKFDFFSWEGTEKTKSELKKRRETKEIATLRRINRLLKKSKKNDGDDDDEEEEEEEEEKEVKDKDLDNKSYFYFPTSSIIRVYIRHRGILKRELSKKLTADGSFLRTLPNGSKTYYKTVLDRNGGSTPKKRTPTDTTTKTTISNCTQPNVAVQVLSKFVSNKPNYLKPDIADSYEKMEEEKPAGPINLRVPPDPSQSLRDSAPMEIESTGRIPMTGVNKDEPEKQQEEESKEKEKEKEIGKEKEQEKEDKPNEAEKRNEGEEIEMGTDKKKELRRGFFHRNKSSMRKKVRKARKLFPQAFSSLKANFVRSGWIDVDDDDDKEELFLENANDRGNAYDRNLKVLNDNEQKNFLDQPYVLLSNIEGNSTQSKDYVYSMENRYSTLYTSSKSFLETTINAAKTNSSSFLIDHQINLINYNPEVEELSLYVGMVVKKVRREIALIKGGLGYCTAVARMTLISQIQNLRNNPDLKEYMHVIERIIQKLVVDESILKDSKKPREDFEDVDAEGEIELEI